MSVSTDLYDAGSPCGAVHIRNKTAVGERLARGSLAMAYRHNISWSGPVPSRVALEDGEATITFQGAPMPLRYSAVPGMTASGAKHGNFEVTTVAAPNSSSSRKWQGWKPATSAEVLSGTGVSAVKITHRAGHAVRGLRYSWGNVPGRGHLDGEVLYGADNLPAGMFIMACGHHSCVPIPFGEVPGA